MRTAHVLSADRLPNMLNQDVGAEPVILVTTDLPYGDLNSFYMDPVDLVGRPVKVSLSNQPADAPLDPEAISYKDLIIFDRQDSLLHKSVSWNGRAFRQRGYSFDISAPEQ